MSSIADRTRDRELRLRILQTRVRRVVERSLPELLPEYLKMVLATVIGFGIVAFLLRRFTEVDPIWVLAGVALGYSLRAAYYKHKLAVDPGYTIPKCGCAGAAGDRSEVVLRSGYGNVLGMPNEVLGVALYVALLVTVHVQQQGAATALAVAAVLVSAYLGYAMVVRIAALCATCVTIAGLNVLILWQLLG